MSEQAEYTLHGQKLVPLKSKAKTRGGHLVVLVSIKPSSFSPLTWVIVRKSETHSNTNLYLVDADTYGTQLNGRYFAGQENEYDITSVLKKWIPAPGDIVRVYGMSAFFSNGLVINESVAQSSEYRVVGPYCLLQGSAFDHQSADECTLIVSNDLYGSYRDPSEISNDSMIVARTKDLRLVRRP